jgi:hypothetical protein
MEHIDLVGFTSKYASIPVFSANNLTPSGLTLPGRALIFAMTSSNLFVLS